MSTLKNNEQNEKEINLNKWTVYIHINKSNQKKYVGITSRKPTVRWKRNGEGYKSSPYFYNAIKKYGWDNFEHNILFTNLSEKEAKEKEKELIKFYKSNIHDFGYNCTEGGDGVCGLKRTPEQIEKIKQALAGRELSEEHKKLLSEIMKGRVFSEDWKNKISQSHIGELNPSARKIVLINTKHELLKIYECMKYAAEELNVHITHIQDVCDKNYSNTGGYIFMYYDEYMEHKEELLKADEIIIKPYKRVVLQYDLNNNFIQEYESIRDAARKTNISRYSIGDNLKGRLKTGGGYIWKYAC